MTEVLRLFTRASKLMRAAADEAMSRHGVRVGQNLLLEVLWERDGLTPGELADQLGVATPTVVNTATRMEAAGLLSRERDVRDRRLVRLCLTPAGWAAQQPIEAARQELADHATATLSAAELRHLRSALMKIITQLENRDRPTDEAPGSGPGASSPPVTRGGRPG